MRRASRLSLAAASLVLAAPSFAQSDQHSFLMDARFERTTATLDSGFGSAAVLAGPRAFVGDPNFGDAGSVSVRRYAYTTWSEEAVLAPALLTQGAAFGSALAAEWDNSNDTGYMIVGAPSDDGAIVDQGSAWIFQGFNPLWVELARLESPNPTPSPGFGHAVAIWGDVAVVGEPFALIGSGRNGAAHVYRRSGSSWNLEQTLTVSLAPNNEPHFGWSVDVHGDTIVVGAPAVNHGCCWGSAYVFRRSGSTWVEVVELYPAMGSGFDAFGACVDYEPPFLAVSESDVSSTSPAGAVHVWYDTGGEWHQEARLTSPNPANTELFGASLEFVDGSLFVGAPGNAEHGTEAGAVYAFHLEPDTWHLAAKLTPYDAMPTAKFGTSVSSDGQRLLVGAPHTFASAGPFAGAVYSYDYFQPEYVGDMYCFGDGSQGACPCGNGSEAGWSMGCVNSTGRAARLFGLGSTSVTAGDLSMNCEGMPTWRPGYLIAALGAHTSGPATPIGDSLSCLTSPRFRSWPVWSDAGGRASWYQLGNLMPGSWVPGTTVHYQVWFRDPSGPCGHHVNLSSAVAVTLTD